MASGHAAAWIGVGGPDAGPNGEDEWLQVGIAALPGMEPQLYAEVTRPGAESEFLSLEKPLTSARRRTWQSSR